MPRRALAEVGSSLCRSRLWKRSPGLREDEETHVDRSHDRRTGQPMARMKSAPTVKEEPSILVVDDYEDNRQMYAELLAYAGYRVEQASDGAQAIATARRIMPHLIVMDLSLPVIDGWEATRRLKGDDRTRHIPVLALTGHAPEGLVGPLGGRARPRAATRSSRSPVRPRRSSSWCEEMLARHAPRRPQGADASQEAPAAPVDSRGRVSDWARA